MASKYRYNVSATSNVDLSAQVRAYRSEVTMNAEEGSVAISTLYVDDEAGGLNLVGHRTIFWSEETEASNNRTILHGFIADRDITRGPFKVGNSRQWAVNVTDPNTLLGRSIMRGTDANRPAETDLARIQWLMTTGEMNLITDSTYINTSATTTAMDAVDYRDQTVLQIVDDCAQASGKNYFVFRNETLVTPALGLWYDFASSTAYTSSVRLTNVLADVDSSTTFAVWNDDLKLNRDPSRVYSSVLLPFDGGEVFDTLDSTRIAFARRDTTAPSVNVKTSAKAHARALRYLGDIATEEDRLTMSYLVPLAKVNQLREGQRFQVKFSHLPGYESWTYVRALKRTVLAISEEFYKVTLEATPGGGSPNSCSAAISSAMSSLSDSGVLPSDYPGGGSSIFPYTFHPNAPASSPSVIIASYWDRNRFDASGVGPTGSVSGDYTLIDCTRSGYSGAFSSLGICGYYASSGAGGNFTVNYSNNWFDQGRAISVAVPSSSSSPIHYGAQVGSGSTATLNGTPTPGNILVVVRYGEGDQGGIPPGLEGVYTLLANEWIYDGSAYVMGCTIMARCVTSSDTAVIPVGDASFSHWSYVTEWAP